MVSIDTEWQALEPNLTVKWSSLVSAQKDGFIDRLSAFTC